MATKKLTIGQKREARQKAAAEAKPTVVKGGDRFDKLISEINRTLDGRGRIMRGSSIQERQFARRPSGIPSVDYILNGGLPKGGLIEIGGEYSTGKTTFALHFCAAEQSRQWALEPELRKGIAWVALEPFSKRWARENGFFVPFSEELVRDADTNEEKPLDSYNDASELEKFRMEKAGIEDPYSELCPFVLVQEERGDVALDVALRLLLSNQFAIIVVDSLGIAKSTKWLEEQGVQDAADFDRTAKMIGDYTARANLYLNKRYDDSNMEAKDGIHFNETTVVHINQITQNIGTQARTPWKKQNIKGGEGNKHNHHAIMFVWKGEQKMVDLPGRGRYVYGQTVNITCIKSKIGAPFMESNFDFYFQPFGEYLAGDIDVAKDVTGLALIANTVGRRGSWIDYDVHSYNGREAFEAFLRSRPDVLEQLRTDTISALKR